MFLVYARRSTDDADNQKNSLEYQEAECLRYAENNGIEIAQDTTAGMIENGVIKERHSAFKSSALSVSGAGLVEYQIERPKFMQMISWLLEGKYAGVIVLCWDRISRNEQSDLIVKELLKKHGIKIYFVQADYDVTTSSGELHMDIDGMFARHHSRVTSEKVRSTFKKLRAEKRCTYFAPIGYLDSGSDNKPFDPERAPLIKRVFEQYDTGEWSVNDLMKWAKQQGLTTKPRRRKRNKKEIMSGEEFTEKCSQPIGKSTLHYMLTNQFYIGRIRANGKWQDGGHAPLIDEALFWRVQNRLKQNNVTVHYIDKPFFTYRGLVKCIDCRRSYSPYRKKGIPYYSCSCREDCSNTVTNIGESIIVEEIQKTLDRIHFTDEELSQIESGAKKGLSQIATKRNAELDDLNDRKKKILKDLDYMKENKITLLREEAMNPAEWKLEADKLMDALKDVEVRLNAQVETEEEMLAYVLNFSELMKSASSLYKYATDAEKRKLAHLVFLELTFKDGKLASYEAKPEFEILLNRPSVQNGSQRTMTLKWFWPMWITALS